ncbi:glutathione-dependent formaldehyde-activating enzyme [Yoonia maritima]|uniref:Glutathione-dependent formaldehyde-activating enzyme n=1 Tax=Yoonia maritima TaxID=1435347 RepID=A0A2T0VWS6_9RHOB|nr:GFA family protein [Yoonia maritima]PRY76286.1 glutathione-dependent formaldehyde-activating enzyme [Yoonia maritima]
MSHKLSGGCDHIKTYSDADPIDNHTCHCSVCKGVTGQPTTHVAFFKHGDLVVDESAGLNRQPFNAANPDGPLELCTCADCGAPIMLDDKESRIRAIVPNLMGYEASFPAATYHAFYDPATGEARPTDGRPVSDALRADFVWPKPS